ncbi:MAG: tRNA epoxyqueuosine(34) reductase QueG [Acidobacteriaceae bacterium]
MQQRILRWLQAEKHIDGLPQLVQRLAQETGFHLAGIAPALGAVHSPKAGHVVPELAYFSQWIAEGRAGEMEYLKRRDAEGRLLRSSVAVPFPWVKSVIVCAVNYNSAQPYSIDREVSAAADGTGWIARYAWSGKAAGNPVPQPDGGKKEPERLEPTDYHSVIRERLERLRALLQKQLGEFEARCFVDTGPLVERVYAKYAGLGWQAKNTCLINQSLGSWFFLGVVLTSLELPAEQWAQPGPDRCGSCTRCIDACPTDALEPYRMDASRCIAYLTIEKRGTIDDELAEKVGRNVFGCDICQEVCPWNRRAPIADWPELQARAELVNPALDWLANLGEEEFRRAFRHSPVERTKFAGWERNVEIARQNLARKQREAGPPRRRANPDSQRGC